MASNFDDLFAEPRPDAKSDLHRGRVFGPYQIERLIAESQFSLVYLALDQELMRPIALKVLKAGPWLSNAVQSRFRREGRVLAQLRHPHIVTLFGIFSLDDQPCLAFEYLRGGTLADVLSQAPISPLSAVNVAKQIARGLSAAHHRNVVHRDLKPQNVLFDDEIEDADLRTEWGMVKISDFGIAKILENFESLSLTGNGQPGTPSFMAPEQVENRKTAIGTATDVHSLGVLIYMLLTGEHPFEGRFVSETLQRIVYSRPIPPAEIVSGIPDWLNQVCLRCLEKAPQDRFPTAIEVTQALSEGMLRSSAVSIREPVLPPAPDVDMVVAKSEMSSQTSAQLKGWLPMLGLIVTLVFLIAAASLRLFGLAG